MPPPKKPQKKPQTLDQFFSPQVSIHTNKDNVYTVSHVLLNEEQAMVLQLCVDGANVFFTGSAGTGKSLLLGAIIRALRRKYTKESGAVAVTASTGMAATNIGGVTLHAWGAISPSARDVDRALKSIYRNKSVADRWRLARVLVIDEVSMIDADLFELVSDIAKRIRGTSRPFGGLQLVVTGDFFQLPPVTPRGETPSFAFESPTWKQAIRRCINLRQVFRQTDPRFVQALESLRVGQPSADAIELFTSLQRALPPVEFHSAIPSSRRSRATVILPTELFPLRKDVSRANRQRLDNLKSQPYRYTASDSGPSRELLAGAVLADSVLVLKLHAQVMLLKNVDEALVNGSVGTVIGFYRSWEVITSADLDGASPNRAGTYIRHVTLVEGQAVLTDQEPDNVRDTARYPLVLFSYTLKGTKADDPRTEAVLIKRDDFRVDDQEGKLLAKRVQLPLVLAWAMSIHKSQGQTIDRIKVNLSKVFEKGQTYVALSRASSIQGLQVVGFDPNKVQAHAKVVEWGLTLEALDNESKESV